MPNLVLWDSQPSPETIIPADGALKNLANNGIAVSSEVANGGDLERMATFELYIHSFAGTPTSGGFFELHIVYKLDGQNYADGRSGDLSNPNLTAATFAGVFPILNSNVAQRIQCTGVPLEPFNFKACVVNKSGQAVANSNGSFLKIYRYTEEVQ